MNATAALPINRVFTSESVGSRPGPKVMKLFSCSTQLSIKFIMPINDKMPTIFDILTFISIINTTPESLKGRKVYFSVF